MNRYEIGKKLHMFSDICLKGKERTIEKQYQKTKFFKSGEDNVEHELNICVHIPDGNITMRHYVRDFSKYLDYDGLLEVIMYNYETNAMEIVFDNISFKTAWLSEYTLFGRESNVDSKEFLQKFDYLLVEEI